MSTNAILANAVANAVAAPVAPKGAPFLLTLAPSAAALVADVREQIANGKTRAEFAAAYSRAGDTFFAYCLIAIAESGLVDMPDGDAFKAARKEWGETWSTNSKDSVRAYATECLSLVRRVKALNLPTAEIGSLRDLRVIGRMKAPADMVSELESPEHEAKVASEREAVRAKVQAEADAKAQAEALAEAEAAQQIYLRKLGEAEAMVDKLRSEADRRIAEIKVREDADGAVIADLRAKVDALTVENADLRAKVDALTARKARKGA